jgi:hypothetical protein
LQMEPTITVMPKLNTIETEVRSPTTPEVQKSLCHNCMVYAFCGWSRFVFAAKDKMRWYFQRFEENYQAQYSTLRRDLSELEKNHHSLVVGYEHHMEEECNNAKQFRSRMMEIAAQKADAHTLNRAIQLAGRAVRADNVVAAGKALIPNQEEEAKDLMRKTVGHSLIMPEQFLTLGNKRGRLIGCTSLLAESGSLRRSSDSSWSGTAEGMDTPSRGATTQVLRLRLRLLSPPLPPSPGSCSGWARWHSSNTHPTWAPSGGHSALGSLGA